MNIYEVDQPENFERKPVDWSAVLFGGTWPTPDAPTGRTLQDFLPEQRFEHIGEFDEDHDDEDRMEEIADDELQHREAPSDEEIDAIAKQNS